MIEPVDEFDEVCFRHDHCYAKANQDFGCTIEDDYFHSYAFRIVDEQVFVLLFNANYSFL